MWPPRARPGRDTEQTEIVRTAPVLRVSCLSRSVTSRSKSQASLSLVLGPAPHPARTVPGLHAGRAQPPPLSPPAMASGTWFGQREPTSEEKRRRAAFTCWDVGEVLELLDLEPLHGHRLALVPGPVDDGAAAALAQDAALVLAVLQLAVLQEEPAGHTAQVRTDARRPGAPGGGSAMLWAGAGPQPKFPVSRESVWDCGCGSERRAVQLPDKRPGL